MQIRLERFFITVIQDVILGRTQVLCQVALPAHVEK